MFNQFCRNWLLDPVSNSIVMNIEEVCADSLSNMIIYVLNYFQNLKKEVRSALDSLISGNKAKQLQTTKDVSNYYFKKIVVQT